MTEILDALTDAIEEEAAKLLRAHRARTALNQAADLAAHMRAAVLHTDGRTEGGTWLPEAKTPLSSVKTDDADELYARIIEWVTYWAGELDPAAVGTLPRGWTRIIQDSPAANPQVQLLGFRAGTNAPLARLLVGAQTSWLLRHDAQIAELPDADQYQIDINKLIWDYRAKYGLTRARERHVRPAECPACGEHAVSAVWTGEGLTDVIISCEDCLRVIPNPTPSKIIRLISTEGVVEGISLECEAGHHFDPRDPEDEEDPGDPESCKAIHCTCACHLPDPRPFGTQVPEVPRVGVILPMPASTADLDPKVCPRCWLYHPDGACDS
jgi:hypothetical protein